jgi:hypothetical protein
MAAPLNTTVTQANSDNVLPPVATYTPENFGKLMDLYKYEDPNNPRDEEETTDLFVQGMVSELAQEYNDPSILSLKTLRDGTAKVLDLFPPLKNLAPEQRSLNNAEILKLFAYDTEGRSAQDPTFLDGVKRKIIGGTAAVPAFIGGMKATNLALSGVPPVTPITAAIRIGGPIVGGLTSAVLAQSGGDYVTEAFMGPEPLLIPGTKGDYVAGQVVAEGGPSFLLGYGASRLVNLGTQKAIQNFLPKSGVGPAQKTPMSTKFTGFVERFVERIGRDARGEIDPRNILPEALGPNNRIKPEFLTPDGKAPLNGWDSILQPNKYYTAMDGKITPKKGVVPNTWFKRFQYAAAESAAVVGSAKAAEAAEEAFPGQAGPRFISELGGGVGGGLLGDFFAKRFVNGLSYVVDGFKIGRKEGFVQGFKSGIIEPLGVGNEARISNYLIDLVEKNGGDVNAVLRSLTDERVAQYLVDDLGNPIDLTKITGATKSRNIALMALEENLAKSGSAIGQQRNKANLQLVEGQKNMILALYATGNPSAIQEASELAKIAFEGGLVRDLEIVTEKYRAAFARLKSGDETETPETLAKLGEQLINIIQSAEQRSRAKQSYLWNQIDGNISISSFVDVRGQETSTPNFVSFWDSFNEKSPWATAELSGKLKNLIGFTNEKAGQLGLRGGDSGRQSVGTPAAVLNFEKTYGDLEGDSIRDYFDRMVAQTLERDGIDLNEPSDEAISKLAQMAAQSRGRRRGDQALPKLYNQKKLALIAQRDAAQVLDSGEEGVRSVTAKELEDMRSEALRLGRQFSSGLNKDNAAARLAYGFAAALERDINSFPEGQNLAYDLARAYSKAHHDVYSRAYAGEVLVTTPTGGVKTAPEEVARQLDASDGAYLKSKELDLIGQNMITQSLTNLLDQSLKGRGDALLSSARAAAFDPDTGAINLTKLQGWINSNRDELSSMPGAVVRGFNEETQLPNVVMVEGGLLEALEEATTATTNLRGNTELIFRSLRNAGAWDDLQGKANIGVLTRWMSNDNNKQLLKIMPDLKRDLDAVVSGDLSASAVFKADTEAIKGRKTNIKKQLSFYDLLAPSAEGAGIENPVTVFGNAISAGQSQPEASLNNLWSVVENAPKSWTNPTTKITYTKEDAVEGFKSALLQAVFQKAGNRDNFSARTAYLNLFGRMEGSKNSRTVLADWMVSKGLFDESQVKSIREFMTEMVELEASALGGNADELKDLIDEMGPSADLMLGILGVKIGNRLQDLLPGQSGAGDLIIAGKSAAAARTMAGKIAKTIPNNLRMDLLERTLSDPKLLTAALRRGKTAQESKRIGSRLVNMLVDFGFAFPRRSVPAITTINEGESTAPPAPEPVKPPLKQRVDELINQTSSVAPTMMPPQPVPAQRVAPPTDTLASAAPPPPPPAASGPVNRQQYAALFPNDVASGLIRQQGIGSLMG